MEHILSFPSPVHIMVAEHDTVSPHSHDYIELVYVLSGRAVQTLDGREAPIREGDFFFLNYGSTHAYSKTGTVSFRIVNCLFRPSFIDKSLLNCRDFTGILNHYLIRLRQETLRQNPSGFIFHDDDSRILHYVNHMREEYERQEPGYLELIRCALIELIIDAMRKISGAHPSEYSEPTLKLIDWIETEYMNRITLGTMAEKMNFSLPYLSKRFHEDTGLTFTEYLQKVRIEQSCHLLTGTDKTILEIASLVGYSDPNFFGEIFRKTMHQSPGSFRRSAR